jgi:hypothetical protein
VLRGRGVGVRELGMAVRGVPHSSPGCPRQRAWHRRACPSRAPRAVSGDEEGRTTEIFPQEPRMCA